MKANIVNISVSNYKVNSSKLFNRKKAVSKFMDVVCISKPQNQAVLSSIKMSWPVKYNPLKYYSRISGEFGEPREIDAETGEVTRIHKGVDIAAPEGTAISSAFKGKVIEVGDVKGWGKYVEIEFEIVNDDGTKTLVRGWYAHLSDISVEVGDEISRGDLIGEVGNTGTSYGKNGGYHLHFAIWVKEEGQDWQAVDPEKHLKPYSPVEFAKDSLIKVKSFFANLLKFL